MKKAATQLALGQVVWLVLGIIAGIILFMFLGDTILKMIEPFAEDMLGNAGQTIGTT